MTTPAYRIEHDLLGEIDVPSAAYYSIHTVRALQNFPISGIAIGSNPDLILALAAIKQAAAIANGKLGRLANSVRNSIGLVTALNPYIGYESATEIAQDALQSGRGVAELVLERGLLTAEALASLLSPERLTQPDRQAMPT